MRSQMQKLWINVIYTFIILEDPKMMLRAIFSSSVLIDPTCFIKAIAGNDNYTRHIRWLTLLISLVATPIEGIRTYCACVWREQWGALRQARHRSTWHRGCAALRWSANAKVMQVHSRARVACPPHLRFCPYCHLACLGDNIVICNWCVVHCACICLRRFTTVR